MTRSQSDHSAPKRAYDLPEVERKCFHGRKIAYFMGLYLDKKNKLFDNSFYFSAPTDTTYMYLLG